MNKKSIIKFAALLLVCCAMLGCKKDKTTTIYGTVFNSVTHEPVLGMEVVVGVKDTYYYHNDTYLISSSVSGTDGLYELAFGEVNVNFPGIYEGQTLPDYYVKYFLEVNADGYNKYHQETSIVEGGTYHIDINLVPR